MSGAVRSVLLGAFVGALAGFVLGLLAHAIFGNDSALIGYEIIPALLGVLFGAILGAFYGGAINVTRKDP